MDYSRAISSVQILGIALMHAIINQSNHIAVSSSANVLDHVLVLEGKFVHGCI